MKRMIIKNLNMNMRNIVMINQTPTICFGEYFSKEKLYCQSKKCRLLFIKSFKPGISGDCIISVKNAGHVRMANFPYPFYIPIIAMVFDRRLWGKKRIVEIIEGEIPKSFINLETIDRYKLERRRW